MFYLSFGQHATIQKCEAAKENVDNSSHDSSEYRIDSNTSIFPVCFYVIHNMSKRSSDCLRIHNQNNVLFGPILLIQIRSRRFVLCLYSHNYFEQEIKNTVFFLLSLLYRFLDHYMVFVHT